MGNKIICVGRVGAEIGITEVYENGILLAQHDWTTEKVEAYIGHWHIRADWNGGDIELTVYPMTMNVFQWMEYKDAIRDAGSNWLDKLIAKLPKNKEVFVVVFDGVHIDT